MAQWFSTSWGEVAFIALSTLAIYVSVIIGIRLGGRRTVSQMSAFDFVVTVAVGTLVASTAVAPDPSLPEALVALTTLLALQAIVAFSRRRWKRFRHAVEIAPLVLVSNGTIDERGARIVQFTRGDVLERLRRRGVFSLEGVELLVLEATGEVTIVRNREDLDSEAIRVLRDDARGSGIPSP